MVVIYALTEELRKSMHIHVSAHDNSRTSDVFRSILLSVRSILRMRGKNVRTAFYVTGNSGKAPVQTVKFSVKKWALDTEKILPMDAIVREERP